MKLLSRRNRKTLLAKLVKIGTIVVIVIAILGSSLQPTAAQSSSIVSDGDRIIGIDLGTTQSVVSFSRDGKTIIIPNEQGNRITPSIVGFTQSEILIGDPAYNQMGKNPRNTVFDAKRFIGREFSDPTVQRDMKLLPFEVINRGNKPYFKVDYKSETKYFSAEEISAMVLQKLKRTAEAYLGGEITKAVITVPAYFDDAQKQATKDAGTIAGLEVVRIINEPTSAALAYGIDKMEHSTETNIIVYDLGGGTFDVSLLTMEEGIFEVVSTGGDTHLGGEDFDENVLAFMIAKFAKKNNGLDIKSNERALAKLRKECEKAKRALSSAKQVKIEIENIMNGVDFSELLTRARFEDLNMKLFRKTLAPLRQVLKDSGFQKSEISEIVLVGGSTRIPKVQSMVRDFFDGKEPNRGINPDEAVAEGAAIQACVIGGYCGIDANIGIFDITPLSLGIETVGGVMTKIVPKGTHIPAQKSQVFSTHSDNQDSVLIRVFQGERAMSKDNRFLGKFILNGIPAQPRGVPQIEVRFEIDVNGLIDIAAFDRSHKDQTQNQMTITRETSNLSQQQIDEAIAEFEAFAAEDERWMERTQAKNALESSVFAAKSKMYDKQAEMSSEDFDALTELCTEMMEWLDINGESAEFDDFMEKQHEFDEVMQQTFGRYTSSHGNGHSEDDHFDHEGL